MMIFPLDLQKPFAFPPVMAALLNFALVLWVFKDTAPGRVRQTFILWSVGLGLWNIGIAAAYFTNDAGVALAWYRFEVATVVRLLAPLFLQFVMAVTKMADDRKSRWVLGASYTISTLFLVVGLFTPALINKVAHFYWGYYPVIEKGEMLFGLPFALTVGYAFYLLRKTIRESSGYRRNQVNYLFIGAVICFGGGVTNFLPFYGFHVYPLGNLLNSIYALIVAYAIVKYDLIDLRLVLRRGTVYALVSGALTLVYVAIIFVLQKLFGRYGLGDGLAFYTAVVPVTVALAPAMKARIEPFIGRAPFWKAPNSAEVLGEFARSIDSGLDVAAVARRSLENARALFHAEGGAVYLTSLSSPLWERSSASGAAAPPAVTDHHPIMETIRRGATAAIREKMLWDIRRQPSTGENMRRRDELESWPYAVTVPLYDRGHLLGVLALQDKTSGAMYNDEDLSMLRDLGRATAALLRSARSTKKRDDMVMMGVVATEMAHELSRPLTHIMNTGSRLEPILNESAREGLAKIERAAQRASDILDSFVMLSPDNSLARETVLLGPLMDEAVATLGIDEDASIRIERRYDAQPQARVHAGQLTQICTNILQNAWQAMPSGGSLRISIDNDVVEHTPAAVIRVEDTGGGIPTHALSRVFDLFFTTKKDKGGRGVGLALSRAMVERHGGRMTIESPIENGRGTRVTIRLPLEPGEPYAE